MKDVLMVVRAELIIIPLFLTPFLQRCCVRTDVAAPGGAYLLT